MDNVQKQVKIMIPILEKEINNQPIDVKENYKYFKPLTFIEDMCREAEAEGKGVIPCEELEDHLLDWFRIKYDITHPLHYILG